MYAPLYVSEEGERANRWDVFLSRGEDGSCATPEKSVQRQQQVPPPPPQPQPPPPATTKTITTDITRRCSPAEGSAVDVVDDAVRFVSSEDVSQAEETRNAAKDFGGCGEDKADGGDGGDEAGHPACHSAADNADDADDGDGGVDGEKNTNGGGNKGGGSGGGNKHGGAGDVWGRNSLDAVAAILEGRNPGRCGLEAPQRERELQAGNTFAPSVSL